ncbi:MAG: HU family DNA-binding protein [Rhodospirillaceae bacterium]
MNKKDLAAEIAKTTTMTKPEAIRAVDEVTVALASALGRGETVNLHGLGVFSIEERAARAGRNPRTGEAISIAASKSPKFRGCGALRAAVSALAKTQQAPGAARDESCNTSQ